MEGSHTQEVIGKTLVLLYRNIDYIPTTMRFSEPSAKCVCA